MTAKTINPDLEELLQRATWARRLARHLVRRQEDADDLVQNAWLVAAEKAARGEALSRPWLSGVLRVLGLNQARAAGRRRQRESELASAQAGWATDRAGLPDEWLSQLETQRRLSEAVLALDEPYRTTVLLRYYGELSAADIARRMAVPAGTVRWRLKEGLERLRGALEESTGKRRSFALAVARFAAGPLRPGLPRWALPAGLAAVGAGVAAGVAALVAVNLAGVDTAPIASTVHPSIRYDETQPAPGKDRDMNTSIGALAAAASLLAQAAPTSAGPASPVIPASKVPRFQVPLGVGPTKGPATAKVTILAFLDYQSPFCLRVNQTIESLMAAHPGQLRYQVIHRPLPFHRQALYATKAAFAAGQQSKFWEMHAALLKNQTALDPPQVEGYAKQLGLDVGRFRADIAGATVTNQADLEEANARSVKIAAVPTTFLNGRLIGGAQPQSVFEQALAEEMAYADAVLASGVRPNDLYTTITKQGVAELPGPPVPGAEDAVRETPGTAAFQATQKLLADNVALANACFEEGRRLRPGLTGRVLVDVRLASGAEARVLLHESTLNFPKVDNCIVQALRKLAYPQLKTGGPIVARRGFAFP